MEDVEKVGLWKNCVVERFSWSDITVTVKDKKTGSPKKIIADVSGQVLGGQLVCLMGASGSGKTTLLNVLAFRPATASASIQGSMFINGSEATASMMRQVSSYVEQEDALIGSMTVWETINFAARLSLPDSISRKQCAERTDELVSAFGLQAQRNTRIGTPLQKGISGGQKRRVSIASQLITCPSVVFLDEPTSGLDSVASHQVMLFVQKFARLNNTLFIVSIHQPSTSTFNLFDKLLLLAQGKTAYFGDVTQLQPFLESISVHMPVQMNPAEFCLEWTNFDFAQESMDVVQSRLADVHNSWENSVGAESLRQAVQSTGNTHANSTINTSNRRSLMSKTLTLIYRSWIKAYRDVVVYGIRIVMYLGLAIMMGTVWLRLGSTQANILPFISAIVSPSRD